MDLFFFFFTGCLFRYEKWKKQSRNHISQKSGPGQDALDLLQDDRKATGARKEGSFGVEAAAGGRTVAVRPGKRARGGGGGAPHGPARVKGIRSELRRGDEVRKLRLTKQKHKERHQSGRGGRGGARGRRR